MITGSLSSIKKTSVNVFPAVIRYSPLVSVYASASVSVYAFVSVYASASVSVSVSIAGYVTESCPVNPEK